MATRQKYAEEEPEQEVLDTAVVAYHVVGAFLNGKRVLDHARVTKVANGILDRLRNAWQKWPVFLASLAELEPLSVRTPSDVPESDAINREIATQLHTLRATCQAFLETYGQPPERRLGFQDREE